MSEPEFLPPQEDSPELKQARKKASVQLGLLFLVLVLLIIVGMIFLLPSAVRSDRIAKKEKLVAPATQTYDIVKTQCDYIGKGVDSYDDVERYYEAYRCKNHTVKLYMNTELPK